MVGEDDVVVIDGRRWEVSAATVRRLVWRLEHERRSRLSAERIAERSLDASLYDDVTGLPGRRLFLDELRSALHGIGDDERLAVLLVDPDRFRSHNERHGRDAGDRLLAALGERLRDALRPSDLVARLDGDKFACLCPGITHREDVPAVAGRLVGTGSEPVLVDGTPVRLTLSVGAAVTGGHASPQELIGRCETAAAVARERGGARYELYDGALRARRESRLRDESRLHRGLRRHQLRVFYQPLLRLADRRVAGVEALVRWQHPERGLLDAAEFIPLAEDTGLITEIDEWVLRTAVEELADGSDLAVAVNLSPRQLLRPRLVEQVAAVLRGAGMAPGRLCLEITESSLLSDDPQVARAIAGLSDLGVEIAIDDFGTGFSSLRHLKRYAVDTLKIDRSFVSGLGSHPDDAAIVSAVVAMARALSLRTVGEGVEHGGQANLLRSMGCELAQGHLFARPMPAPQLADWLPRQGPRPGGAGTAGPRSRGRRRIRDGA